MVNLTQDLLIVAWILADCCSIPLATATDAGQGALQLVLAAHLVLVGIQRVGGLHGTEHVLPDIEGTLTCIRAPPADECLVVGSCVTNLPINLRNVVIDPSLLYPFQHVGIEVVIVLRAVGGTSSRVVSLVAIDAERTDAKLYPRLCLANRLTHLFHELIDILTTPISYVHAASIRVIGSIVWNGNARNRVRVEVVIDVDAIDVVAGDDVVYDLADEFAVFGSSRVEENKSVVVEEAVGVARVFVGRSQSRRSLRLGPIRIDPGMQFHLSSMALLNHPLQRVPIRVWRHSLLSGQEAAPRLYPAGIERVAFYTHLEEDGVDAVLLQVVELTGEHCLHLVALHVHELSVDSLNPCSAKLSLGILSHCQGCHEEQHNKQFMLHSASIITKHICPLAVGTDASERRNGGLPD